MSPRKTRPLLLRVGHALDAGISAFFPAWGARRNEARRRDELHRAVTAAAERRTQSRAWEAAESDRFRGSKWLVSKLSPNSQLEQDLQTLRDRAEDLYRNDSYAASAINGRVNNVVGSGWKDRLQSRIEATEGVIDDLESDRLQSTLERKFRKWARRDRFNRKHRQFERCRALYGEAIAVASDIVRPGFDENDIPLTIQIVHPKRLETPVGRRVIRFADRKRQFVDLTTEEWKAIRLGIRFDDTGVPSHYYLRTTDPNDNADPRAEYEEYPASRVRHSFEELFQGQIRGIPWLAPAMGALKDIKDFGEANLISEQIAACFSVFIKKTDPYGAAEGNAAVTDTNGDRLEDIEPGMVQYLGQDEEAQFADPNRPGNTLAPFLEANLRGVAAAIEFPYELLAKDYSKTTYSSGRLSLIAGRIAFRCWQNEHIDDWLTWLYETWLDETVMFDDDVEIDPSSYLENLDTYRAHEWVAPGWPWIDPVKEVQASVDAIAGNLATETDELASLGRDAQQIRKTRERERIAQLEVEARVARRRQELESELGESLLTDEVSGAEL